MLPRIDTPTYELTLPISKQKIKYRPFLVKEQKILLMSIQADDSNFVNDNVMQVLKNCCLTQKVDLDSICSVDMEYYFLHLRARSIGEIVESKYRCQQDLPSGETCANLMQVNVNLLEVELDKNNYSDIVNLTDNIGIKFKYPNIKTVEELQDTGDNILEKTLNVIINCIDYIFDDDNFYYPKETTKQEMLDFIDSLNVEQFNKIKEYFENLPKLKKELNVTCEKCGYEHKIVLEGLQNFLG